MMPIWRRFRWTVAGMAGGLPIGTTPWKRWICWIQGHIESGYEYGHRYPSMFCWRCGKELADGPTRAWDRMDAKRNRSALRYRPRRLESRATIRSMKEFK